MNELKKYCRYKGYMLHVDKVENDVIKAYTTERHIGQTLKMKCLDRDSFELDIAKNKLECLWTIESEELFYDSIKVLCGNLVVENCEGRIDKWHSKFIQNGEFAFYNGKVYRSISGYNHKVWFKLSSIDIKSQQYGFIMEEPGIFIKCVAPSRIDFAFESMTFCVYKEKEFVIIESSINEKLLIEPYDRGLYPDKNLIEMGFEIINTKWAKWIEPSKLERVWTKTKPIHDFDRYKNYDEVLKK